MQMLLLDRVYTLFLRNMVSLKQNKLIKKRKVGKYNEGGINMEAKTLTKLGQNFSFYNNYLMMLY